MAHEIESMFSVKETPWHKLGVVLEDAPATAAEAMKLAGMDWGVIKQPLFLGDGREVDSKAVVRETDGAILGVVGKDWTPLQNADAFEWFNPFISAGEARFTTAGSLRGGKRVWVMAELNRRPAEIGKGDEVRKFLLLSNSHDGTLAVRCGFTPVRVVCANTLAMAHGNGGSQLLRLKHTRNLAATLTAVRDVVNAADAAFEATAEQYRFLASRRVNRDDLKAYVKQALALQDEKGKTPEAQRRGEAREGLTARSFSALNAVLDRFDGQGYGSELTTTRGTWWGAYNALTEYLAYERGHDKAERLDSLWYGGAAKLNADALALALDMAV